MARTILDAVSRSLFRTICTGLMLTSAANSALANTGPDYQQFIGDWELVNYVVFPESGGERDMNYTGYLSYDAQGNMAGLGMPKDLPERAADSDDRVTGGFAYWGTVSVEAAEERVIHHVQGSPMVPRWVGGDNIRYYEFVDDLLNLSLRNEAGRITATLTWRKLR